MEEKNEVKKCSVWLCNNPYYALGLCKAHWTAKRRYGSVYGKHKEQKIAVNDLILKGRLIAIRVLGEYSHEKKCPYCGGVFGEHQPLCVVKLSISFLSDTEGINNKI